MIDLDEMIKTRPADFITKIKSEPVKREDVKNNHDINEENNVLKTSTSSDMKKVLLGSKCIYQINSLMFRYLIRMLCGVKCLILISMK